ncbi:MAG: J domain-containing protein [Gallionella sp.]|nr:J domain-containing protein [Gallionella sp.]MDD4958215.1 J domain-containing protein [Gallionella sp.]
MNYYEVLEVSTNASPAVIRAAYKSLIQRYHPDRHPDDAETAQRASRIVQAYEVLADAHLRAVYDMELKQQAAPLRVRNQAATLTSVGESHGYLWSVIAVLLLAGVYFLSFSKTTSEDALKVFRAPLSRQQQTQAPPELVKQSTLEKDRNRMGRTLPKFISALAIKLRVPASDSAAKSAVPAERILTIATLSVVVGSFDADTFIRHIESNREFISQKLGEKLVDAQYDRLTRNDAELYLRMLILDALNEITQTNRNEDYPPSKTENPGRYGVIAVALPESFSVK